MAIRPICVIITNNSGLLYKKTFEMCLGGKYYQAYLLQTSIAIYGSTSLYIPVIQIRRGLSDKPGFVGVERMRSQKWRGWPAAEDIWKYFLYFTSGYFTFLLHTSQHLSIKITPSPTLNRASTVAKLPQLTQNFIFPLWRTSVKDLNEVNTFSILLFHLMRSTWLILHHTRWLWYQ